MENPDTKKYHRSNIIVLGVDKLGSTTGGVKIYARNLHI